MAFKLVADLDKALKIKNIDLKIGTDGASASVKGVKPDAAREWSVSAGKGETQGETGQTNAGTQKSETAARLKYALDVVTIFLMVVSYYSKKRIYASDGTMSASEELDLTLDLAKIVLKTTALLAKIASAALEKTGKVASKAVSVLGEAASVVMAVIYLVQTVRSESEKYRGDQVFWETLTTGFDESTATFYFALVSAIIGIVTLAVVAGLGTMAAASFLAVLGPIGWAALLVYIVVLLILNWDSLTHWVDGTVDDKTRDQAVRSMTSTLQGTAGTVAALNDFRSDAIMASARESRGNGFLLSSLASFSTSGRLAFEFHNLSARAYDLAFARECQAKASRSLRFFIVDLWMQADDLIDDDTAGIQKSWEKSDRYGFRDTNRGGEEYGFDGDIMIGSRSELTQHEIPGFLLGLNGTSAQEVVVSYRLKQNGGIPEDALKDWMSTIACIGDQVSVWQERLLSSQAKARYVGELDGLTYRNDLGYMQIGISAAYSSVKVRLSSTDKAPLAFLDCGVLRSAEALELDLTCSTFPLSVYVWPGEYSVEVVSTVPPMIPARTRTVVKAFPLYAPKFSSGEIHIKPKSSPIYFTIESSFNGTANISVGCFDFYGNPKGTLFSGRNFSMADSPSGEFFIDARWVPLFDADGRGWMVFGNDFGSGSEDDPLKLEIRITVGLDRDSDGTVDAWANQTIGLKSIRDDHVARMKSDDKKTDRQLRYSLEIYNEPRIVNYGYTQDLNPVPITSFSDWKLAGS